MTTQESIESKFQFTYLHYNYIPPSLDGQDMPQTEHSRLTYECANFNDFLDKTSKNELLKIRDIGLPFNKLFKNIPTRTYIHCTPPFDVGKLDLKDNLAHIWLYQAYILDTNSQMSRSFALAQHHLEVSIRNEINDMLLNRNDEFRQKDDFSIKKLSNFFNKDVNQINLEYLKQEDEYNRFVNALIQLQLYLYNNTSVGKFNFNNYQCDRTYFCPLGFAFEPLTYLFYFTQKSGFYHHSLTPICAFQKMFRDSVNFTKKNDGINVEFSFTNTVYPYEIEICEFSEVLNKHKVSVNK